MKAKIKTVKMKKVLIALDYNPNAQKVAELGFSLAKTMKADVILLHVLANAAYYASAEHVMVLGFADYQSILPIPLDSADNLRNRAQHFLDKLKHRLDNKNIKTVVKEGDLAETILETAKETHADVIVMGTHSMKWLENITMGSGTEKVLRLTTIPLFLIPTKK